MKKILSVLSLIAILGVTTPAFAGPGGPHGGPHGGPRHGGGHHHIQAGHHHHPGHHIRPHGGISIHAGHPRHSYWGGFRGGYWRSPYCDYRLGWCDSYYSPYIVPYNGASFSIRF